METMSTWVFHVEYARVGCRIIVDIKDFDVGNQFFMTSKNS